MNASCDPLAAAARTLDEARRTRSAATQQAVAAVQGIDAAYAVQRHGIALRTARGERPLGVKMGFTSRAKMAQMGVSDMIVGQLTDAMGVDDGGTLHHGDFIHPRVEPEVAFRLSRDWIPAQPMTPEALLRSVDAVAPAMEVIDSRYRDFRFDLPAVVADNTSAAAFVIGPWQRVARAIDNLGLCMRVDGRASNGSTAAILGDPWRSLMAAARLAAAHGIPIGAGAIVLAGAATAAEPLPRSGVVETEISGLGRVQFRVEPGQARPA